MKFSADMVGCEAATALPCGTDAAGAKEREEAERSTSIGAVGVGDRG